MKNLIKNSLILFLALTLFNCSKDVIPPDNTAPVAVDDIASTTVNTPINVPVLSNDSDPNGDSITVTNINGTAVALGDGVQVPVTGATATLLANGTIEVTPTADSTTPISFPYTIGDGNGGTDTAQVELSFGNTAPIAVDDTASTTVNTPINVPVLSNDSDPNGDSITVTNINGTAVTLGDGVQVPVTGGTATLLANGTIEVTPTADSTTPISFPYTIGDGNGGTDTAQVELSVIETAFVTTWKTDNPGFSNDNQIKITTNNNPSSYTVDWGDGEISTNLIGDNTHTYATAGIYTVKITGDFKQIYFDFSATHDAEKLLSVENWGNTQWETMNRAFANSRNLIINATDVPNLSNVTDMSRMFWRATSFNTDISGWNVSNVTNMSSMFSNATSFNQPIGAWKVNAVTNMRYMFAGATSFNQPIGDWKVNAVTNMSGMFNNATSFNQPIGAWKVNAVTDMSFMFEGASSFNQPIGSWKVSAVTDMTAMFWEATSFNQLIGDWEVSAVTDMTAMFWEATSFNQPIGDWKVNAVTNMNSMFQGASAFNQNISSWDVSAVTKMGRMFQDASAFSNKDLSPWPVANVTSYDDFMTGAGAGNTEPNWP